MRPLPAVPQEAQAEVCYAHGLTPGPCEIQAYDLTFHRALFGNEILRHSIRISRDECVGECDDAARTPTACSNDEVIAGSEPIWELSDPFRVCMPQAYVDSLVIVTGRSHFRTSLLQCLDDCMVTPV